MSRRISFFESSFSKVIANKLKLLIIEQSQELIKEISYYLYLENDIIIKADSEQKGLSVDDITLKSMFFFFFKLSTQKVGI